MANQAQRKKLVRDLALYFAEKGKVLDQKEYIAAKDTPVKFSKVREIMRSYSRCLEVIQASEPELWDMATKPKKVEPAKPAPEVKVEAPKPPPVPKPKIEVPKVVVPKISVPKPNIDVGKPAEAAKDE
jgi:hypothetical protein